MKKLFALLFVAGLVASSPTAAPLDGTRDVQGLAAAESSWIVKRTDNIVGLKDANQLSNPAVINFKRCLAATPEMKKMKKDGIGPDSPEGIRLRSTGVNRVTRAANTVRKAGGYCSVWKKVKHKDGRRIPDLTTRVVGQY
jgi:hypothetical protein